MSGKLDVEALEKSLNALALRHEVLRTTFHYDGIQSEPVQRIHPHEHWRLQVYDFSAVSEEERGAHLQTLIERMGKERFCLDRLPLVRWALVQMSSQEHVLIQVEHHLVHDGYSFNILLSELTKLYNCYIGCLSSKVDFQLPGFQYADFAVWERRWMLTNSAQRQLTYWREKLSGCRTTFPLRLSGRTIGNSSIRFSLPIGLCKRLRAISISKKITLFTVMLGAFVALLRAVPGETDIPVGTGIANRRHSE